MSDAGTQSFLPTENVSQIVVNVGPGEFIITVGHTKVSMSMEGEVVTSNQRVQWLQALTMSPTTAELLLRSLEAAKQVYESNFGPIPFMKDAKPKMTEADISSSS